VSPPATRRPGTGWAALLAALVTIAVHATGLGGGFVYDDHRFIEHNAAIRTVPLVGAFTDPATASAGDGIQHDIYRPLRTLLFALEYQLFARTGAGGEIDFHLPMWHFVSLLLHVLNALLVLRLLLPLLRGAVMPAALGALVFAVHPLTSESVAWLSSQGDLLALTLLLIGLVVMERRGVGRTCGGAALFFLACLAKESALMLPLLLPLRDLALPRQGATGPSPWAGTTWVRAGTLAGVAGLYFVIRLGVLPGLAQVEHPDGNVLASVRGMLHGMGWYARSILMPLGFSFDTRLDVPLRWTDPEVAVGLGVVGTLLAAGIGGLALRRYVLALAALGFLVTLGPVSNVLVPLKTFVADRFLYPGLVCVGAGLAAGLASLRGTPRSTCLTLGVAAVLAFGGLTIDRNAAWAGERALWERVRQDRPWNANAYQGIAYEFLAERRIVDAENALATYLEANPIDGKAMFRMGTLFGDLAESLVLVGPDRPGEETNVVTRQRQARVAQIKLYQRAFEVWSAPGGLQQGRGSPQMLLAMLNEWIDAGTALGDLGTAKYANDQAIELESGGAVRHDDLEAVWTKGSWFRRRVRVDLALRAVRATNDERMPAALRESLMATRAAVLRDCRLDPGLGDAALRAPLIVLFRSLIAEGLAAPDFQPDPLAFADLAGLLLRDDPRASQEVLRQGLRAHPGDLFLQEQLQAVDALIEKPGR